MSLLFIEWNADPTIITLLGFPIRWYGLCFAFAFLAGFQVVSYMFKKEGRPVEQADQLLIYTMVGTVVGARMGHYFFYEFPLLLADPVRFFIQMITPPFSGLASHGAAIGLFTAYYLYTKKNKDQSYLYVTDRIVIATALAGFFIRFGNLMNSEIIGKPTELPWGFKFLKDFLATDIFEFDDKKKMFYLKDKSNLLDYDILQVLFELKLAIPYLIFTLGSSIEFSTFINNGESKLYNISFLSGFKDILDLPYKALTRSSAVFSLVNRLAIHFTR